MVVSFFTLTPSLTCIFVYFEIDPFIYILRNLLPTNPIFINIFRILICAICIFEAFNVLAIIILLIITFILIISKLVGDIDHIDTFDKLISNYRVIYITIQLLAPISSNVSSALMLLGLVVGVMFSFTSIALVKIIPFVLYPFFPGVSVLIMYLVIVGLSFGANIHMETEHVLGRASKMISDAIPSTDGKEMKIRMKTLRCMKSTCFHCGVGGFNFFSWTKSTQISYYKSYVDYTITALLSVKH